MSTKRNPPGGGEHEIQAGSSAVLARIADIEHRRRMGNDEATGALAPGEIAGTIRARELMAKTFAPPVWIVRGLVAQGLTAVSGKPKMGKSWLLLALALARAGGGRFLNSLTLDPGPVLYLALEDTEESLQDRLRIVLQGAGAPEDLTLATAAQMADWHMNNGGIERIGGWLEAHPGGCVIVDTLAKIKPARRGNGDAYAEDYAVGARLKAAADAHNGAVIIVTHNRKASADDPLDEINATTGLMGAFDTGRRVRDAELALRFDADACVWSLMGDASKYATSKERAEILQAIEELVQATGKPAHRKQIAEAVQKPSSNVGYLLTQMTNAQQVIAREGGYLLSTPNSPNSPNTPNTTNIPNTANTSTVSGVRASEYAPNSVDVADTPGNISPLHSTVRGVRTVRANVSDVSDAVIACARDPVPCTHPPELRQALMGGGVICRQCTARIDDAPRLA